MGDLTRSQFERATVGNTFGAFGAGINPGGAYSPGSGFFGASVYSSFYGMGAGIRHFGGAMATGLRGSGGLIAAATTGPFHMVNDYRKWRVKAARLEQMKRASADLLPIEMSSLELGPESAAFQQAYGRQIISDHGKGITGIRNRLIDGQYGPRRFGARSVSEHLAQGTRTMLKTSILSPTAWGLNLAFAGMMSDNNLLDPKNGLAKAFAESVGGEIGFLGGGTAGIALATAMFPGAGLAIKGLGYLAGAFTGAMVGSSIPSLLTSYAEFGMQNGQKGRPFRSSFVNSDTAITMRQRGVQAIYRSQMNARSSMGNEALAFHS